MAEIISNSLPPTPYYKERTLERIERVSTNNAANLQAKNTERMKEDLNKLMDESQFWMDWQLRKEYRRRRIQKIKCGKRNGARLHPRMSYSGEEFSIFSLNEKLLHARACGDEGRVRELLFLGADHNFQCAQGFTPLHIATSNGHVNVLNILLEDGADVNGGQTIRMTPLHYAAKRSSPSCVASLITAGADIDRKIKYGLTALHLACTADCEDVVQLLLNARADCTATNAFGHTPIDLAISERVERLFYIYVATFIEEDRPPKGS